MSCHRSTHLLLDFNSHVTPQCDTIQERHNSSREMKVHDLQCKISRAMLTYWAVCSQICVCVSTSNIHDILCLSVATWDVKQAVSIGATSLVVWHTWIHSICLELLSMTPAMNSILAGHPVYSTNHSLWYTVIKNDSSCREQIGETFKTGTMIKGSRYKMQYLVIYCVT